MREILFRAKRKSNGKWIEGYIYKQIVNLNDEYYIRRGDTDYLVVPETVGQFTGLTDKNGNKIFEGDIVHAVYQVGYVGCKDIDYGIGVVKYCASYYGGASYEIEIIGESYSRVFTASLENGVEVIGNVYDNPELLKPKGEQLCFFNLSRMQAL